MPKNIGGLLKKYRNDAGITVRQISDILIENGYRASESTIYSWENDNSQPVPGALLTMCAAYGIRNVLSAFGYDDRNDDNSVRLNNSEKNLIEKYRFLDAAGRRHIDIILDWESERIHDISVSRSRDTLNRMYPYFRKITCTGAGFGFDDIPSDTIEAPYMEGADFVIGVSGNSMEPDYHDGDKIYVRKAEHIAAGDIGIYTIGNECCLKELGPDSLISNNSTRQNIPDSEHIRLIGKVIGKVSE